MTDQDRLLAAIVADPDDDTARLAFTDLLEERGSEEERQATRDRAVFIRLQIRLAEIVATDPEPLSLQKNGHRLSAPTPWGQMSYTYWPYFTAEHLRLLRKEAKLLSRYAATWEAGLPSRSRQVYQMPWNRFRRGFVGAAGADMSRLLGSGNELWERHPIDALELEGVRGRDRKKLLTFRPMEQVRELGLHPIKTAFDRETAHALAESPHLRHLRTLHLGWSHFDAPAASAFAASPHLRPRFLSLSAQRMSAVGFSRMMNSPFASMLDRLALHKMPVYDGGLALPMISTPWVGEVLAETPTLARLNGLLLDGAEIGSAGVLALTRSPHQPQLMQLGLAYNLIDDKGVEALAAWRGVRRVKYLGLGGNPITVTGVEALVSSPYLHPEHLNLFGTQIGDAGVLALSRWAGLKGVRYLDLSYSAIGSAGVTALLESQYMARVRYLVLSGNDAAWQRQGELRERFGERVTP